MNWIHSPKDATGDVGLINLDLVGRIKGYDKRIVFVKAPSAEFGASYDWTFKSEERAQEIYDMLVNRVVEI